MTMIDKATGRPIKPSTRINSVTMPASAPGFGWIASHASGPRHLRSLARIRPTAPISLVIQF